MYKIKQIPEDFIVKEIFDLKKKKLSLTGSKEHPYAYFLLTKRDYTTMKAVSFIAHRLNMPSNKIGFAGNKDKNAVTEQYISIRFGGKERVENLNIKDIDLKFIGYSAEPISLGDLSENSFEIVVRNLTKNKLPQTITKIPNYFGEQRFSDNNYIIGKCIVKKDFKKAVEILIKNEKEFGPRIEDFIKKDPKNYIGVLRLFPLKILKIYVHAYQSHMWNKIAEAYIKKQDKSIDEIKNIKIPIVGFQTGLGNPDIKDYVVKIMKKEELVQRDFIIRPIPELSSAGDYRSLFTTVRNLDISQPEEDELNLGKYKYKLKFSLSKGSYATVVIDQMFS
jgi:tRNA pseudouridine13 synthase